MSNILINKIYHKRSIEKVESEVKMLGERARFDAITFMNIRLFTTLLIFILVIYISSNGYIYAPIAAILNYYLMYYIFISSPLKKRIRDLDHEALYFFEILTLSLESGRNLENAIETTVFNVEGELSNEFRKALFEIKFGKTLMEALEDMKKRIPSETINNILLNITQTRIFGNSIIETMNNQIDFLRDKQILEIKGEINKIPNKVSIISVLFIVPLILMLVLGPFIIEILR